jgi:hypothetical protein
MDNYSCNVRSLPTHEETSMPNPAPGRRRLLTGLVAVGLLATVPCAFAQADWPTKPIRLVVSFAPGRDWAWKSPHE